MNDLIRCFGNKPGEEYYADYHDKEWGVPVHEDQKLFEMLILEGAQAGLSWSTILKRRDGYREAFLDFDPKRVSKMSDSELESLLLNGNIIRNRLKVFSARQNAEAFIKIQDEFGSFDHYIWSFVDFEPITNNFQTFSEVPVSTPVSDAISKDLKKRGMKFVGSTIMYAYMQAVGMVDDHLTSCFIKKDIIQKN